MKEDKAMEMKKEIRSSVRTEILVPYEPDKTYEYGQGFQGITLENAYVALDKIKDELDADMNARVTISPGRVGVTFGHLRTENHTESL